MLPSAESAVRCIVPRPETIRRSGTENFPSRIFYAAEEAVTGGRDLERQRLRPEAGWVRQVPGGCPVPECCGLRASEGNDEPVTDVFFGRRALSFCRRPEDGGIGSVSV